MGWGRSALFGPRRLRPLSLRHRAADRLWLCVPLLVLALACAPALLTAAKPPADTSDANSYDSQLSLRARRVLSEDAQLAPHNLGVTIRDSVATLWGSAPSEAAARRAAEALRHLPGVAEVRNEIRIEPPDDPIEEFLAQKLPRPRESPAEQSVAQPRRTVGELTGLSDERRTKDPHENTRPCKSQEKPSAVLLPPIPLPTDAGSAGPSKNLELAIERLRQVAERFQGISAEIHSGTVYLRGTVRRWDDINEFARAIARMPGVEHVILRNVQVK